MEYSGKWRFVESIRRFLLLAVISCLASALSAQEIDSVFTSASRGSQTVSDEIQDPAERAAYIAVFRKNDPATVLGLAQAFLHKYPQSARLAEIYERAARGCFDLGDLKSGMDYAHQSLALLPENPFFLVVVADVQARQHENDAARASARDALDYFDRFDRPAAIPQHGWSDLKRTQQAAAYFVIGRALIQSVLQKSPGQDRQMVLQDGASSLLHAEALNPDDSEITYLLGLDYLSLEEWSRAAAEFAAVYRRGGDFAPRAREQLGVIYKAKKPAAQGGFEAFLTDVEKQERPVFSPSLIAGTGSAAQLPGYAGSQACQNCHGGVYRQWAQTGMAKMLRPYLPQNIIGDFEKNNEFYAGDRFAYLNGKLEITQTSEHSLFARMVLHGGRHYFEIKQADGLWHSYPVDYTIGSKWQQAYATKLANGQIHVFPIQYNVLQKKWVDYWEVIDSGGSERSNPHNWEKLDASSNYQTNCAVCHTGQLRNPQGGGREGPNLVFREPGIGCEMCHGPSAGHIAAITNGDANGNKQPLDPPVAFEKLSSREFVSICAQCHMQSNLHMLSPRGELNYSTTGTFFLQNAALPLGEFSRKAFFKDGRARQTTFMVEALERSKCFRHGQVTCGTCHDPHGHDFSSNNTSLKFKDQPDLMCVGCHTQFQDKVSAAAHTHHPLESEASRCISCHMPPIMDALLFRARSHQIDDIPNAEMTLRFGQQDSPNACMLCHTEKTAQWVQSELESWKTPSQTTANTQPPAHAPASSPTGIPPAEH
jgi:predicted CXXCH cytochrome family protein